METDFQKRVIAVVRAIPRGQTMSYGEVAAYAGRPGAARAVGTVMKQNQDTSIPCHRVIHADGSLGGYNGLAGEKRALLKSEGVLVK